MILSCKKQFRLFFCFHVKVRYLSCNLQYIFRFYVKSIQKYVILYKGSQMWFATQMNAINFWQILSPINGHFDHFKVSKIWLCWICLLLDAWKLKNIEILKFYRCKMSCFRDTKYLKLISRKIWVASKSFNFYTVLSDTRKITCLLLWYSP